MGERFGADSSPNDNSHMYPCMQSGHVPAAHMLCKSPLERHCILFT